MIRFFSIAVLLGLSLAMVNESDAKGPGNGGKSSHHNLQNHSGTNSHNNYRGIHQRNWSSWSWSRDYGCYFYWCPTDSCYFYWYAPGNCYYPASYLSTYPPTVLVQQAPVQGVAPLPVPVNVQVTNTNQNVAANGSVAPGIPGMLPAAP